MKFRGCSLASRKRNSLRDKKPHEGKYGPGQTAKNSLRANAFRVTPESGHCSMQSACPKSATGFFFADRTGRGGRCSILNTRLAQREQTISLRATISRRAAVEFRYSRISCSKFGTLFQVEGWFLTPP
jgi:hypothetical protein